MLNAAVIVPTMREHISIIEAIRNQESTMAGQAMRMHIISARNRALEQRRFTNATHSLRLPNYWQYLGF
jgi:DNA-binding GntR family transcriptional regulator